MKNSTDSLPKTYPCNDLLREQLRSMHHAPDSIWTIAEISRKLGYSRAVISQYLSDDGCKYDGDVATLEKKAEDFLQALERRRTSGIETSPCDIADQMDSAFTIIRKTNDLGAIIAESGEGKTRGIELILKNNPLARLIEVTEWSCDKWSILREIWASIPHDGWDRQSPRTIWMVQKMRGTDWPFIFDDAHKLTRDALSLLTTLQEKTGCPFALVGVVDLVKKLEHASLGGQSSSRVGTYWSMKSTPKGNGKLLVHMIKSVAKTVDGDLDELLELCKQVAAHHGHFRAVHKQLKLAAELRLGNDALTWPAAFRAAHHHLLRQYKLS